MHQDRCYLRTASHTYWLQSLLPCTRGADSQSREHSQENMGSRDRATGLGSGGGEFNVGVLSETRTIPAAAAAARSLFTRDACTRKQAAGCAYACLSPCSWVYFKRLYFYMISVYVSSSCLASDRPTSFLHLFTIDQLVD